MNLDLEERLEQEGIRYGRLTKSDKVKLLTRWSRAFPDLMASARHQEERESVRRDSEAVELYWRLASCDFYILPDDDSAMPSYLCLSAKAPELSDLVSDVFTRCDELVVVDRGFTWSAVFVNHGAAGPSRHFSSHPDETGTVFE